MDYQRRGACCHIMAASDPHLRCPGCRDCFLPGNPCSMCESLSAEQVALAIQARSLRLRRQARRAGSTDSSQCGPLQDKTDPSSVSGQGGRDLPPRDLFDRGMVVGAVHLPSRCPPWQGKMATRVGIPPWDVGLRMVVVVRVSSPVLSPLAGRTSCGDSKLSGDALALR